MLSTPVTVDATPVDEWLTDPVTLDRLEDALEANRVRVKGYAVDVDRAQMLDVRQKLHSRDAATLILHLLREVVR